MHRRVVRAASPVAKLNTFNLSDKVSSTVHSLIRLADAGAEGGRFGWRAEAGSVLGERLSVA